MPVHWVEFRKGFWIATTEITNAQYEQFRPEHEHERDWPRQGDDYPITEVTWTEAKAYCSWLAARTRRPIRLPSEAEWECACRAGSDDEFTFGDDAERLSEYAWFDEDRESGPWAVATKEPNRWDLFDLHGNAWEWCEDTLHSSYRGAPTDGAAWVSETPPLRVIRGGDWRFPVRGCRSAHRNGGGPERRNPLLGFRPAFSNPDD
jgi:formylglycine-generating enzyme required for sulfatase activity